MAACQARRSATVIARRTPNRTTCPCARCPGPAGAAPWARVQARRWQPAHPPRGGRLGGGGGECGLVDGSRRIGRGGTVLATEVRQHVGRLHALVVAIAHPPALSAAGTRKRIKGVVALCFAGAVDGFVAVHGSSSQCL